MFMRNVIIKNYKCFKEERLEFSNLTVLTGRNSAGKSSLIQALLLYELSGKSKRIYTNSIFGLNLGSPERLINIDENHDTEELSFCIGVDTDISYFIPPKETFSENYLLVEGKSQSDKNIYYLNAERIGPRALQLVEKTDVEDVGTFGQNTLFVLHRLANTTRKTFFPEGLKKKTGNFKHECEYWVNEIIDDLHFEVDVNGELGISTLRFKENGIDILPTNVGFGISYILPIIVQGLHLSVLNKNDGKNRVLIVENPEAHLHPAGQSRIGQFLAALSHKGGVQVVVETHSDHVINGMRLYYLQESESFSSMKMYYFDKKDGEHYVHSIDLDNTGEMLNWPKGFFDQAKTDLFEMMKIRQGK